MVDTLVSPSLGYMEIVNNRTAATLLPIIQNHVHPGTTVWSDQWSAYGTVGSLANVSTHATVNHSVTFVAPSGVHTQNIESYWNTIKIKLKRMRGCTADQLPSYLEEFVYRKRYGITCRQMFNSIASDIAQEYPV